MKKRDEIGSEKYSIGELSQLARRRMIQKDHGDKSQYNRKEKHKNVRFSEKVFRGNGR